MICARMSNLLLHFTRNGAYQSEGDELLVIERGEGPYLFDTNGRRYLDGLSNLFCCQLGYSYGAEMAEVAGEQLRELPFNSNWGTAHPAALQLAVKVASLAPEGLEQVFFTNGGSESVEAAWKIVRLYHLARGEPQRTKAIARDRAYHGVTLGALSFTGVPGYKEPFGLAAVPTRHVSNTNPFRRPEEGSELTRTLLAEIEGAIVEEGPATVAMVIAEPVQNAGGCLLAPEGYWAGLRALCDRYGVLLVADEVITAFGRLGEWFAVSKLGAIPDLITVAKGLTSAYAPMGAVVVSERVAAPLFDHGRTLLHGITFGGHPLSAAIALRNLEIFERDGVLENVRAQEGYLAGALDELRALPIVGDVRGAGFFWAIELVPDHGVGRFDAEQREELLRRFLPGAMLDAGLLVRGDDRGDTVVHVAPPLICEQDVLDELAVGLRVVLEAAAEHMEISKGAHV
jgi:adenosylmethionine-8-amino-7-oxononanoate aminotransferase